MFDWCQIWWKLRFASKVCRFDGLLDADVKRVGLQSRVELAEKAGLSARDLLLVRQGRVDQITLERLLSLAKVLQCEWTEVVEKYAPAHVAPHFLRLDYARECERLSAKLNDQEKSLSRQFRTQVIHRLSSLISQYPTIRLVVERKKPDLPARVVLELLKHLDTLLADWNVEMIGPVWEPVPFDPSLHQADEDVSPGETVFVRNCGIVLDGQTLYHAKVTKTLP